MPSGRRPAGRAAHDAGGMTRIHPVRVLVYYDGPQVIEARDAIGGHYIVVLSSPIEGEDRYVVAGVPPERLRQFKAGGVDLRTLLVESDPDLRYLARAPGGPDDALVLETPSAGAFDDGLLPDAGFVLSDAPADDDALPDMLPRDAAGSAPIGTVSTGAEPAVRRNRT